MPPAEITRSIMMQCTKMHKPVEASSFDEDREVTMKCEKEWE